MRCGRQASRMILVRLVGFVLYGLHGVDNPVSFQARSVNLTTFHFFANIFSGALQSIRKRGTKT